jgi:hypothetical protein
MWRGGKKKMSGATLAEAGCPALDESSGLEEGS